MHWFAPSHEPARESRPALASAWRRHRPPRVSGLLLLLAAFVAGAVSITSPCCLPLLPGYLSYISSVPVDGLDDENAQRRTLRASLRFVGGFGLVFTALGVGAALIGRDLLVHMPTIIRIAGVMVIALGLTTLGSCVCRALQGTPDRPGPGTTRPGMSLSDGHGLRSWLDTVYRTDPGIYPRRRASTTTAWWGAILLATYSAALGIPFILLGQGFGRVRTTLAWLQRHGRVVERFSGGLLIVIGVLLVTGRWQALFRPLQVRFAQLGWPPI